MYVHAATYVWFAGVLPFVGPIGREYGSWGRLSQICSLNVTEKKRMHRNFVGFLCSNFETKAHVFIFVKNVNSMSMLPRRESLINGASLVWLCE